MKLSERKVRLVGVFPSSVAEGCCANVHDRQGSAMGSSFHCEGPCRLCFLASKGQQIHTKEG